MTSNAFQKYGIWPWMRISTPFYSVLNFFFFYYQPPKIGTNWNKTSCCLTTGIGGFQPHLTRKLYQKYSDLRRSGKINKKSQVPAGELVLFEQRFILTDCVALFFSHFPKPLDPSRRDGLSEVHAERRPGERCGEQNQTAGRKTGAGTLRQRPHLQHQQSE